jgi:FtsH-binding integral membrane protein
MNTPQLIMTAILSISGFPLGFFLSKYIKEELKQGKPFFVLIIVLSIIGMILSLILVKSDALIFLISALVFVFLLFLACFLKARK